MKKDALKGAVKTFNTQFIEYESIILQLIAVLTVIVITSNVSSHS